MQKKILIIVGTRPEAIKMAPVYQALAREAKFAVEVLNSGQHDVLIDQVFEAFDWQADHTLTLTRKTHDVAELYALLFAKLSEAFRRIKPDFILVHGDTATTAVASWIAFLQRIGVGHVEAGLRSFRREEPWPEEMNRRLTDMVADLYFAPTAMARQNLLAEGVADEAIAVTGNTVVDALLFMAQKIKTDAALAQELKKTYAFLDADKKTILVTGHRRENFGKNLNQVFSALKRIALETGCQIVFPVHPNQKIQAEIDLSFLNVPHIHLLPALDYPNFVYLMQRCDLIISDSGGVQEEAPTFGKKLLITRNVTERPEGVDAGFLELVGCDEELLASRAKAILADSAQLSAKNPYGDGQAAERICKLLIDKLFPTGLAEANDDTEETHALIAV